MYLKQEPPPNLLSTEDVDNDAEDVKTMPHTQVQNGIDGGGSQRARPRATEKWVVRNAELVTGPRCKLRGSFPTFSCRDIACRHRWLDIRKGVVVSLSLSHTRPTEETKGKQRAWASSDEEEEEEQEASGKFRSRW